MHCLDAKKGTSYICFLFQFHFKCFPFSFQIEPKEQCVVALTKMSSCPACQGIPDIRPCSDYCINVMKGCLAYHAELGDSWDKFIGMREQHFFPSCSQEISHPFLKVCLHAHLSFLKQPLL